MMARKCCCLVLAADIYRQPAQFIFKRGAFCQNDGTQMFPSFTRSGILQAASAVHLTVVSGDVTDEITLT